jgi:uncharacterized spore protein YtfJ
MGVEDPIKTTVEELRKVLNVENVVGEIIETNGKLIIPVTKMGMGFGAGMGESKSSKGPGGEGAASGGAAKIEPIAMVVIFKGVEGPEGVKLLSLRAPDTISRAIGEIGTAAVEVMSQGTRMMKQKGKEHETEGAEEESKPES